MGPSGAVGDVGRHEPVPILPTVSPRAAFEALFGSLFGRDDNDARKRALADGRRSVLDLVLQQYHELTPKLSGSDRLRVDRHLDELRDLERRVSTFPALPTGGACEPLADPGPDPVVGRPVGLDDDGQYDVEAGWSDEDRRAELFADIIAMALSCDLTRSVSLMYTYAQSHMNFYGITGEAMGLHDLSHIGPDTATLSRAIAWHVDHYARLVARLRDLPDGPGTLLDNCAVLLVHEGGFGWDPQRGNALSSHSTENMACLLAGRAGGLDAGRHVPTSGAHPAQVLISAMHAVGVERDLGEVQGIIPELFGA